MMRGPQEVFIGKRRQGRIIRAVNARGKWSGRRGKMYIRLWLDDQPDFEHQRVSFTASIFRERVTGKVGTVVQAIEQIEEFYRDRTLVPRREKEARRRADVRVATATAARRQKERQQQ